MFEFRKFFSYKENERYINLIQQQLKFSQNREITNLKIHNGTTQQRNGKKNGTSASENPRLPVTMQISRQEGCAGSAPGRYPQKNAPEKEIHEPVIVFKFLIGPSPNYVVTSHPRHILHAAARKRAEENFHVV